MTMTDNNLELVFQTSGVILKKNKRRRSTRKEWIASTVVRFCSYNYRREGEREALCVVKARGGGGRDEKKRG